MKFRLSGKFGELAEVRDWQPHTGIDLAVPKGETLRSIADGVVTKVFDGSGSIGKGVAIKVKEGQTHIFGHMSQTSVKPGQELHAGDTLGLSGSTGNSTASHLHFGVQNPDGSFVDPAPLAEAVDAATGKMSFGDWFKMRGAVNQYNPKAEDGSWFWDWVGSQLQSGLLHMWNWVVLNLPDIMGYATIGAGIFIILGAMIGKGGMMKPLSIYAGLLILAICILGGV